MSDTLNKSQHLIKDPPLVEGNHTFGTITDKISSIVAIVGLFNLPIIRYSVDWWNTLHQPSSITLTSAPTIHYTMLIPLIIMFVAMLIYSLIIFLMRYKIETIKFKLMARNINSIHKTIKMIFFLFKQVSPQR